MRIIIIHCALETDKNKVFAMAENDGQLIQAIINYAAKKENEDGDEVFERKDNIIVTNKGYYMACWESVLQNKNWGI
jgi:predicted RNA-binding protein associated with RNAse of E/G family